MEGRARLSHQQQAASTWKPAPFSQFHIRLMDRALATIALLRAERQWPVPVLVLHCLPGILGGDKLEGAGNLELTYQVDRPGA